MNSPIVEHAGLLMAHRVALLLLSLSLLGLILELVRRGLLKERYALLWMLTSLAGFVVGMFPGVLLWLSALLRFQYVTVLFVLYFLFTLGLVLSFSIVISRLHEQHRELTQEVALLAHALKRLEEKHRE